LDDVERALLQISDIQARMAASTSFRGFAPEAMASTAVLFLAVAAAQAIWPDTLAHDPFDYLLVWGGATVGSILICVTEAVVRSHSVHGAFAHAMLGTTLRLLLPFLAAGIVIVMLIGLLSPANIWMLPGLWQMLIGLAGFSAALRLPRAMLLASGWYFVCGTLVFALAARTQLLSPWMMGLPLGIGQAMVGLILYRANGGADAKQ
jgi:hypothetical protein